MKMKKLILTAAFAAITMAAGAQSLNVSSAFQNMRKGYLNKAKAEIDAACLHDATKDDAKTWCYKALIYARIGGEASNKKSKFKDLAPDWAEQAYQAALECKRLDTQNEWAKEVNEVFSYVGQDFYVRSSEAYNSRNYPEAMQLAEKSTEMFNNAGQAQFASDALFIAGLSAYYQHDTASIKKYFNNLTRKRTDKNIVYVTLFAIYKAEGDNEQAMKIANTYVRNCKNDPNAYLLQADGYFLSGNVDKGSENVEKALELSKADTANYPKVLVQAGSLLDESARNYEAAEAKFRESMKLQPTQFGAYYNMGKMLYNRAVDKNTAAIAVDPFSDEGGLIDKLVGESKSLFGQSIEYFEKAVAYIDGLATDEAKNAHRADLANTLDALANAYARIDKLDEAKATRARLEQLVK